MVEGSMTQGAGHGPVLKAMVSWRPAGPDAGPEAGPEGGRQTGQAAAPGNGSYGFADASGAPVLPGTPGVLGAPGTGAAIGADGPAGAPASFAAPAAPVQVPAAAPPAGYEATQLDTRLVPEDYTPTAHDLPVIAPVDADQPGPLYVVGDVHGYIDELRTALHAQGLIDAEGHWSAGTARLWFLGDFTDRGPDGIGVIELVMQLSAEAAAAGGYAKAIMGNHELLLLGAHRFGDTPVNSTGGTASFLAAWRLNGGQPSDMDRLEDRHLTWMSRLDAAHLTDGHLLLHSDTTAYLDYGTTIDAMNDAVTGILQRGDADECWDLFRKLTKRFAFRGDNGPQAARELLDTYGGHQVVHGHSPIPYLLGEVGGEYTADGEERTPVVNGPMAYAENLALAMDGGVTMDGRLLVAELPPLS
ncbi:serine/threonine protein phosphatase [Streptomyces sp. So13.3]|uniref:metallophosphoesterase n=1 Tax=Streptomyces TaxID=1883 RepID=UPI001106778C|nr:MULTISPECIES: metallophosphoesterase [Streptomyces]QNA74255.1 serine/threonine protein phosphatase [Streptomyces sp. So13.3]